MVLQEVGKMSEESTFDLEKIIFDSTEELKKISGEAQEYLLSLATEELQTRLTAGRAREIAQTLLEKISEEEDSQ